MEILKLYGGNETDSEDELRVTVESAAPSKTTDYLGLADSSDDDCPSEPNAKQNNGVPRHVASGLADIDLLVTSYRCSDQTCGPENSVSRDTLSDMKLVTMENSKSRKRKLGDNCQPKYKTTHYNLNVATLKYEVSGLVEQNCTNRVKFEDHPNIREFIDSSSHTSRLPKFRFKTLCGHSGCVNKLAWCAKQHSHLLLSASMDKQVNVWDVFNGICVFTWKSPASVCSAVWALNGTHFVSAGYDKVAKLVDVELGKEVSAYLHQDIVSCVRYHPIDDHLFVTGSLGKLSLWDTRNDEAVTDFESKFGQVLDVIFLHDGREVVCSNDIVMRDSADRTIMAWDVSTGAILSNQIYQERYTCPALVAHPLNDYFVAQSNGNYIAQFSTVRPYKMNRKKRYESHKVEGYRTGCDFSSDGQYLYSGSSDGNVYCYNSHASSLVKCLATGVEEASLSITSHPVLDSMIAVSFWDGTIQLWQ